MAQVRFDAAPSLASKAFSSEEIQKILAHAPGSHYLVECEVYTNALYGEHFTLLSRTNMVAYGPQQCQLQLVYTVDFKPSLSRLMKPMVAKGVDGAAQGLVVMVTCHGLALIAPGVCGIHTCTGVGCGAGY